MTFPSLSVSMSVCLPVLSCLCVVRKSAGPREKEPTLSHAAGRLREREHARSVDCHPALARAFKSFSGEEPISVGLFRGKREKGEEEEEERRRRRVY